METEPRTRVLHVFTVPQSLVFLRGQAAFMRDRGYEIAVMTRGGDELASFGAEESVATMPARIHRRISPLDDVVALGEIYRAITVWKPAIVHAHTPKGGLLGTLAALGARVDRRVYHMRGLPSLTARGASRVLLENAERTTCVAATRVVAVSHSLREVAIERRLVSRDKIEVLGHGSGQGVDLDRFRPADPDERRSARARFGLDSESAVLGFVGRLTHDKGVGELYRAFELVAERLPNTKLLIVGSEDERVPLDRQLMKAMQDNPRVLMVGWGDPKFAYAAMDVFVMPTHREGFSNVLLEAAASGLPCVTTSAVGARDAVRPGETGAVVDAESPRQLAQAIERYLESEDLRRRHGREGRAMVERDFSRTVVWEHLAALYDRLMGEAGE